MLEKAQEEKVRLDNVLHMSSSSGNELTSLPDEEFSTPSFLFSAIMNTFKGC
jgi:hypothetical protein